MKLADMKDANGTSLQSHVDVFKDKLEEFGVLYAIFFVQSGAGIVLPELDMVSNVDPKKLGVFLHSLANQMRNTPAGLDEEGKIAEA